MGWPDQVWSGFLNFFFPESGNLRAGHPFPQDCRSDSGYLEKLGLGGSSLGEVGGAFLGIVPTPILTLGDHLFFGFFFPGVCLGP